MKKSAYGLILLLATGSLVQCARINTAIDLKALLEKPAFTPGESGFENNNPIVLRPDGEDDPVRDAPLPGASATIQFKRVCAYRDRMYYEKLNDSIELRLVESPAAQASNIVHVTQAPHIIHFRWALPAFPLPKNHEILIPLSVVKNLASERIQRLSLEICKETAPQSATGVDSPQCVPRRGGWELNPFAGYASAVQRDEDTVVAPFILSFYHAQVKPNEADNIANCDLTVGSPLVLDLEGNGIALSGPESGVLFDLDGDGRMEKVGWTHDAFLALDRNGNRRIDNATELFGNYTRLKNAERAANGFVALGEFDLNGDRLIDRKDAAFSELLLWQDANFNGESEPGEIESLAARVSAISLDYRVREEVDRFGNESRERAIFWDLQWVPKVVIDIWFVMIGH